MRDKVITGLCGACIVVLIAAGSAQARTSLPPPRAGYWHLMHLHPLVVVASWDEADYQKTNAVRTECIVGRLRLKVHRVLKGKCGKTVEVRFSGGYSLRRAFEADYWWRFDEENQERDVERWGISCNVQSTGLGPGGPWPVRRDARKPAVYFLSRDKMLHMLFLRSSKWSPTAYVLRGEKLHELPHLIPPDDPKKYSEWEALKEFNAKGGGPDRKKKPEWAVCVLGQIQPLYTANGWAALLAGKKPDVVFRYFQQFDPYSRKLALKELQQYKDRKVLTDLADEAINNYDIHVLSYAGTIPSFREILLSRLSQLRTRRDMWHYENVWRWVISDAKKGARDLAAKLLAGDSVTVEQKQAILRALTARAHRAGGGDEAVLIARRLSDPSAKIRETARDCLVDMLVARGGANLGRKPPRYSAPKPGALKHVVAALAKEFGQAGWAQIVRKHPELKTAPQLPAQRPQKAPSRKPTRPEDIPAEKYLQQFKQGWLPKGPDRKPWWVLAENIDKDFALPVMAKALLTADIPDGNRGRCLASLVEAAVAYPERVRVALSEHGDPEFSDILAVQCFLDPATDARRLAAKLKDRSDTEARRRRHIYAEAIFVTDKGLNLLREIIREGKSWDNKLSAALVVAKWLEPAQTRMVLAGMKNVPKYLRVKMIVKQPLGKAERAQAIKTLRGLVARVKKTGRPVNCSVEEFKIAKEAAQKLGTGGHPKAMEALADFLLQRPYDADSRGGQYRPWWGCKKALGDLCRGSPRQYLRVKAGLKNDEDDRWDKVVREWESRASKPQWLGKKDMLKALASLSAEQSQDRSQLRLGVLGYYGTKVSDPRSAAGIAALARAMFGRPDSPRAAPYSQRYERMCMADLVERVIAHEFGLRGRYAIRACEHLPEKDRVEKLSAILTRLAKTQVNGGG